MVEIGPRKEEAEGAYSLQSSSGAVTVITVITTELKWEQLILNYEGHERRQTNELEFGGSSI